MIGSGARIFSSSFPRKRESGRRNGGALPPWMPAFAGMTNWLRVGDSIRPDPALARRGRCREGPKDDGCRLGRRDLEPGRAHDAHHAVAAEAQAKAERLEER